MINYAASSTSTSDNGIFFLPFQLIFSFSFFCLLGDGRFKFQSIFFVFLFLQEFDAGVSLLQRVSTKFFVRSYEEDTSQLIISITTMDSLIVSFVIYVFFTQNPN